MTAEYGAEPGPDEARALASGVRCSVLVVHGTDDEIASHTRGRALAGTREATSSWSRAAGTRRTRATRSSSTSSATSPEAPVIISPEREQSRARYPDEEGYVERDGVRVFYEVYGTRRRRSCSSRTSPISHSRLWKGQVPYLSRYFRVVVFDPAGTGNRIGRTTPRRTRTGR